MPIDSGAPVDGGAPVDSGAPVDICSACAESEYCDEGFCQERGCPPGSTTLVLGPAFVRHAEVRVKASLGQTTLGAVTERGAGDDDGSYIFANHAGLSGAEIRYDHAQAPSLEGRKIVGVNVRARSRRTEQDVRAQVGLAIGFYFKSRAGRALDPRYNTAHMFNTVVYTLATYFQAQHPWDKRDWQASDLEDIEILINLKPDSLQNEVRVTQAWLEVCHAPL